MPLLSRPARGAWVEILLDKYDVEDNMSRAPQGARGLKFLQVVMFYRVVIGRAPQGARGLK